MLEAGTVVDYTGNADNPGYWMPHDGQLTDYAGTPIPRAPVVGNDFLAPTTFTGRSFSLEPEKGWRDQEPILEATRGNLERFQHTRVWQNPELQDNWSEYQYLDSSSEVIFPVRFANMNHLASFVNNVCLKNAFFLHRLREGLYFNRLVITHRNIYRDLPTGLRALARTRSTQQQRLHRVHIDGDLVSHTVEDYGIPPSQW